MQKNVIKISNSEERLKFLTDLQNNRVSHILSPIGTKKLYPIYEPQMQGKDFLKDMPDFVSYIKYKNSSLFYETNPLYVEGYVLKNKCDMNMLNSYKKMADKASFKSPFIDAIKDANSLDDVNIDDSIVGSLKYVSALNSTFGYNIADELKSAIKNKETKEWIYFKSKVLVKVKTTPLPNDYVKVVMTTIPRNKKEYTYSLINDKTFVCMGVSE